ncbi:hypothetical protein QZH41_012748 [Actinostola sp. cb2023]|nr:hypothetical protein QZH41_012748 [Actinostola sp. cb2023]
MSSADLTRKRKIRGGHKGSLTQIFGVVDEIMDLEDPAGHEPKLRQLMTTLEEKLSLLHTLDDEILALVKDEDIEGEIEEADRLRGNIRHYMFRIEEKLSLILVKINRQLLKIINNLQVLINNLQVLINNLQVLINNLLVLFEGRPYNAPMSPPLPESRIKECPPFTFTGIDFAGPLYVSEGKKKPSYK